MPNFSEADIRAGASAQSYSRGVSYQRDGAVLAVAQRDNVITAEVTGSDYDPYDVEIHLDATGAIHSAGCSCPYEQGGYCKHIVAVLLAVLENSEDIAVHPSVASLLAGLGEAELRQLIVNVAQDEPGFADAIEREVNLLRKTREGAVTPAGSAPAPVVDLAAVRRDLRRSFRLATQGGGRDHHHDYYDYDEGGYIDADAMLQPHLTAARLFLAGGHPAAAAELLAAAIDEWGECVTDLEEWVYEASEDSIDGAVTSVDFLLAECLLSQPLSPAERRGWEERLDAWAEDAMELAITELALAAWWDDPWLQAALQGQIFEPMDATAANDLAEEIEEDAAEDFDEDFEDDFEEDSEEDEQYDVQTLTPVWLSILEREGRTQEYLNLALAAGETVPYLLKLVAIGAVEQAVAVALAGPLSAAASLSVAKALAEQQRRPEALAVAAHGLAAPSTHATGGLAAWLAPLAEQCGRARTGAPRCPHRLSQPPHPGRLSGCGARGRLLLARCQGRTAGRAEDRKQLSGHGHLPLRADAAGSNGARRQPLLLWRSGAGGGGNEQGLSRLGDPAVQASRRADHERGEGSGLCRCCRLAAPGAGNLRTAWTPG
jgi:hypothetical protein